VDEFAAAVKYLRAADSVVVVKNGCLDEEVEPVGEGFLEYREDV